MNQDAAVMVPRGSDASDWLLMVADGMGAHAAGELASKMAVEVVPHVFHKSKQESTADGLRDAILEANAHVYAKGASSPEFQGMGTTCSCLLLTGEAALVGHVGDSRVYRLRKGLLEQLTFDHSLVWEMAEAGKTTEDKIPAYIPKNVITRSLGPQEALKVDLEGPYAVESGDTYLLCSDGLTGVVNDQLLGTLMGALPPEEVAETLIDLANLGGGPDNISVVIARAEGVPGNVEQPNSKQGRAPLLGVYASIVAWFAFLLGKKQKEASCAAPLPCSPMGTHGKGPYRSYDCQDAGDSARMLGELARELAGQPAVQESSSPSSHAQILQRLGEIDALREGGDAPSALVGYASLIREQMQAAARSSNEGDSLP